MTNYLRKLELDRAGEEALAARAEALLLARSKKVGMAPRALLAQVMPKTADPNDAIVQELIRRLNARS